MIHIKKVGQDTVYSGEIVDPSLKYESPALPPNYEEEERERQQMIKEAQGYSDEELEDGAELAFLYFNTRRIAW